MSNLERLKSTFRESLGLAAEIDVAACAYGEIEEWDSVAHMQLVAAIEDAFDVMLETEDVIGMSSFAVAVDLLGKNHGIDFDA